MSSAPAALSPTEGPSACLRAPDPVALRGPRYRDRYSSPGRKKLERLLCTRRSAAIAALRSWQCVDDKLQIIVARAKLYRPRCRCGGYGVFLDGVMVARPMIGRRARHRAGAAAGALTVSDGNCDGEPPPLRARKAARASAATTAPAAIQRPRLIRLVTKKCRGKDSSASRKLPGVHPSLAPSDPAPGSRVPAGGGRWINVFPVRRSRHRSVGGGIGWVLISGTLREDPWDTRQTRRKDRCSPFGCRQSFAHRRNRT